MYPGVTLCVGTQHQYTALASVDNLMFKVHIHWNQESVDLFIVPFAHVYLASESLVISLFYFTIIVLHCLYCSGH